MSTQRGRGGAPSRGGRGGKKPNSDDSHHSNTPSTRGRPNTAPAVPSADKPKIPFTVLEIYL